MAIGESEGAETTEEVAEEKEATIEEIAADVVIADVVDVVAAVITSGPIKTKMASNWQLTECKSPEADTEVTEVAEEETILALKGPTTRNSRAKCNVVVEEEAVVVQTNGQQRQRVRTTTKRR